MIEYYFGYFNFHGNINAITWYEENGITVGAPNYRNLVIKIEISSSLRTLPLSKLQEMYPAPTLPLE